MSEAMTSLSTILWCDSSGLEMGGAEISRRIWLDGDLGCQNKAHFLRH